MSIIIWTSCLLFFMISCCFAGGNNNNDCAADWVRFKSKYDKSYNDRIEHDKRMAIFCTNLARINSYNERVGIKKLGINRRSDWSQDDFKKILITEPIDDESVIQFPHFLNLTDSPPDELDYRADRRIVGRIKNQGHCGSCWAFGAIALIEANEHRWNSSITKVTPLSEQQLVDCIPKDHGKDGCSGRNYLESLFYVKSAGGVMRKADYKYISGRTEKSQDCKFNASQIHPATRNIRNFIRVGGQNEDLLKRLVASYGPVLVSIQAKEEFHYIEGKNIIFDPTCDGSTNHAVLLLGYGRNETQGLDYWIIKNSWGDDWGDEGFGYMARNMNNSCSIANKPIILI